MKRELPQGFHVWNTEKRVLENIYIDGTFSHAFASVVIRCLNELEKEDISLDSIFSKSRTPDIVSMRGYLIVMFHKALERTRPTVASISRRVCGIFRINRTVYNYHKEKFDKGLFDIIEKSRFGRSVSGYLMEFSGTSIINVDDTRVFTFKEIKSLTEGCPSCLERFRGRFHDITSGGDTDK